MVCVCVCVCVCVSVYPCLLRGFWVCVSVCVWGLVVIWLQLMKLVCASVCSCLDGYFDAKWTSAFKTTWNLHEFREQRLFAQMVKFKSKFLNLSDLFDVCSLTLFIALALASVELYCHLERKARKTLTAKCNYIYVTSGLFFMNIFVCLYFVFKNEFSGWSDYARLVSRR